MDRPSWYRRPDWAGHFHSGQPQAGAGVAVRNLPSGPIFEAIPDAFLRRGKASNPYQVGSLGKASDGSAFFVANGWYGGMGDTLAAAGTSAVTDTKIDTWKRDNLPIKDNGNTLTYGVQVFVITRIYDTPVASGVFTRYEWGRYLQFDSRGWLAEISGESLRSADVISGSGSAGGGI